MSQNDQATARDYRTVLESSPNDVELARQVFRSIQDNGGSALSKFVTSTTISTLTKQGALDESFEVLEYAREKGVHVDNRVYAMVLHGYSRNDQHSSTLRVFEAMRADNRVLLPRQYISAVTSAVKLQQRDRVFEILNYMRKQSVERNSVYNHVLGAACQTKQHELVMELFDYMHQSGAKDMAVAFHNIIRLAFKLEEHEFVLDLLKLMRTQGVDSTRECKNVLLYMHKAGLYDKLLSVFDNMRNAGYDCDAETYGSVLSAAIRLKKRDVVFDILDRVKLNIDKSDIATILPRVVGTSVKTEQRELALQIFDNMCGDGVTTIAYHSTVRSAFKVGDFDFIIQLLRLMKEHNLDPTEEYKLVIVACHRAQQFEELVRVFDSMRQAEHACDVTTYSMAASAATELKKRELAFEILDDMKENMGMSTTATRGFPAVVGTALKTKQFELAHDLFNYMHENGINSSSSYHNSARLAFKAGDFDFVLRLLLNMKKHGKNPTKEFKSLLISMHKADLYEEVLRVFDAIRNAEVCDDDMYGVILAAAIELGKRDLVFKILDNLKEEFGGLSKVKAETFRRLVRVAVKVKQHELLLDLFDWMHHAGVSSIDSYSTAVRTAFAVNQYDLVLRILRKMNKCNLDASSEYFHALRSFHKAGCFEQFLLTFLDIRDCGYNMDISEYKTALTEAVKLNKHDTVLDICFGVDDSGLDSKNVYSYALHLARTANQQDLEEKLIHDERNHGSVLPVATTSKNRERPQTFPRKLEGKPAILQHYLKKMRSEVVAYSLALRKADESSDGQVVVPQILDHLLKIAVHPNAVFIRVLEDADKAKQHDLVVAITKHMTKNSVGLTVVMFEVVLRSCARVSDLKTALETVLAMSQHGLGMTDNGACFLIKCAAKLDQWDVALNLMADMQRGGFTPSITAYTVALNECGDRRCLNAAVDIYKVMPDELRRQLRGMSLRAVIQGHVEKGTYLRVSDFENEQEARDILEKLQEKKLQEKIASVDSVKDAAPDSGTEPSVDSVKDAAPDSGTGLLGYLSSFFKRLMYT